MIPITAAPFAPGIRPGFYPVRRSLARADGPVGLSGDIIVKYLDGVRWAFWTEFVYCSVLLQTCVRIESGFETNFASIPTILHWYLSPTDPRIAPAAAIHDKLYRTPSIPVTKGEADGVLVEGMALLGASRALRWQVGMALRLFGRNYQPRVRPG